MHEIQRPAGGFVAWKMCENTHTMDAPGCAGEASMCPCIMIMLTYTPLFYFLQEDGADLEHTDGFNDTATGNSNASNLLSGL